MNLPWCICETIHSNIGLAWGLSSLRIFGQRKHHSFNFMILCIYLLTCCFYAWEVFIELFTLVSINRIETDF